MKTVLLCAILLLWIQGVDAETLYNQIPPSTAQTGTLYQSSLWFPDGHNTDVYIYDSFVLPTAKAVTEIRWRGGFRNAGSSVDGFTVNLYGSNQYDQLISTPPTGPCTSCLAQFTIAGNAGQTPAGTFGAVPLYDYTLILATPFQAAAGAKYWVQIEGRQSAVPDWGLAAGVSATPNGHTEYWVNELLGFWPKAGDTAFAIIGPNTAPVAVTQSTTAVAGVAMDLTLSATDADGDPLTYRVTISPAHGTLTGTPPTLRYTPASDYSGQDAVSFVANDGYTDSNEASVNISVKINTPPTATPQSVSLGENASAVITLSGTDSDGDPLTFRLASLPLFGTLTGNAPSLIYTPDQNQAGPDSFTFVANDGLVDSQPATVDLSVLAGVRLVGGNDFQLLQDAYNSAFDGGSVLVQAITLYEYLQFDVVPGVKIRGGYDHSFSIQLPDGMTTVKGSMVIGSGSVSLDRIAIQ